MNSESTSRVANAVAEEQSSPAADHEADPETWSCPCKDCQCAECSRPEPRSWACEYQCACQECEEARSPTGVAGSCFCEDFVFHLEEMPACIECNDGELEACVAELGEERLASVALALRLAHLLFRSKMHSKARNLYERYLLPRLFACEARRDELLGAASQDSLVHHAFSYASACFAGDHMHRLEYASIKKTMLVVLDIIQRFTTFGDNSDEVATAYSFLARSCLGLKERDNARRYAQLANESDRASGDERRLAIRCCRRGSLLLQIAELYELDEKLRILELHLEIAEAACEACRKSGFLADALCVLGELLVKRRLDLARGESCLKRVVLETEQWRCENRSRDLPRILHWLGNLSLESDHFVEAAAFLRRGFVLLEAMRGLVNEESDRFFESIFALLSRKHDAALASFCSQKLRAFVRETRKMPACINLKAGTPGISLQLTPESLESLFEMMKISAKVEERKRAAEEAKRAEALREQARREAERAEHADRDAADREAALRHMQRLKWPRARQLLNAVLKRSPEDTVARLLRIQCVAGAGDLEAAVREAEAWERELAASDGGTDRELLAKVQQERQKAESSMRSRRGAGMDAAEDDQLQGRVDQEEQGHAQREEGAEVEHSRREGAHDPRPTTSASAAPDPAVAADAAAGPSRQPPCRHYARGSCAFGARCRFAHTGAAPTGGGDVGSSGRTAPPAPAPGVGVGVDAAGPAGEEGECAICYEPLGAAAGASSSTVLFSCGHQDCFCALCIDTWRAKAGASATCPTCRDPFAAAGPSGISTSAAEMHPVAGPSAASSSAPLAPAGPSVAPAASAPAPPALPAPAAVAATFVSDPEPSSSNGSAGPAAAQAAAPAAARVASVPRPTRPYLPPGGPRPLARPTRPYDPFTRGAGPSR
eukprot:tig00000204_g17685.t1